MHAPEKQPRTHHNIAASIDDIDFTLLEKNPDFRADFLYFLRLSNRYIESIFWHVFENTKSSGQKNKRKILKECVEQIIDDGNFTECNLMEEIFLEGKNKHLDCFSRDFERILKALPAGLKDAFTKKMEIEHGIFITYEELVAALQNFRDKRNHLEHYPTTKRGDDVKICNDLGMFILPEILHHFTGRIAHYATKTDSGNEKATLNALKQTLDTFFTEKNKFRRYKTNEKVQFSQSKKQIKEKRLHKSERVKLVDPSAPWRCARRRTSSHESDYRENRFKMCYYFIGKKNFNTIENMLAGADAKTPRNDDKPIFRRDGKAISFKRDIEPLYMLGMKTGLVLHRYLTLCVAHETEKLHPKYPSKNSRNKDPYKTEIKQNCADLLTIRNHLAHNSPFWDIWDNEEKRKLSVGEVFDRAFNAVASRDITNHKGEKTAQILSNMHQQLIAPMAAENIALLTIEGDNTLHKIKNWDHEKRSEYKKQRYHIDKRPYFKKEIAKWKKSADFAYQSAKKSYEKQHKNAKNNAG